jgi:hypothetical protein
MEILKKNKEQVETDNINLMETLRNKENEMDEIKKKKVELERKK